MTETYEDFRKWVGYPAELGSLLQDLVGSGRLTDIINGLLREMGTGTGVLTAVSPRTLVLHRDSAFTLFLRRVDGLYGQEDGGADDYIFSPRSDATMLFLGSAPVTIRRYRTAEPVENGRFVEGIALVLADETIADGPHHERLGDRYVYDYASEAPFFLLRIDYAPYTELTWHYSRSELLSKFASASQMTQSTMICLSQVLGAMGGQAALPHLRTIAGDASHFVRWAAIQAIGKIDAEEAVRLLHTAVNDDHPYIRRAATAALAQLGR